MSSRMCKSYTKLRVVKQEAPQLYYILYHSFAVFHLQRRTNELIESNTAILKDLLSPTSDGKNRAAILQALEQIGKTATNSDYTSEFAEVPKRSPVDS